MNTSWLLPRYPAAHRAITDNQSSKTDHTQPMQQRIAM